MHSRADLAHFMDMMVQECHQASKDAGWWEDGTGLYVCGTKIALIHSEISEALEGLRKNKLDEHLPDLFSIQVELADALIRIFDLAGALNISLGEPWKRKLDYNAQRADHKIENRLKSGGKRF